jgi:hypothetical protein
VGGMCVLSGHRGDKLLLVLLLQERCCCRC